MVDDLRDNFDEVIPGAAEKGPMFLKVVQERTTQENLGIVLKPVVVRKTQQVYLAADMQFGGMIFKGAPMKLIVHADPIGSSLQVGWQLTEEELGGIMSLSQSNRAAQASRQIRNMRPEVQRKLSGIVKAFHVTIFLPTMQQLADAVQAASRPQGSSGFLGA